MISRKALISTAGVGTIAALAALSYTTLSDRPALNELPQVADISVMEIMDATTMAEWSKAAGVGEALLQSGIAMEEHVQDKAMRASRFADSKMVQYADDEVASDIIATSRKDGALEAGLGQWTPEKLDRFIDMIMETDAELSNAFTQGRDVLVAGGVPSNQAETYIRNLGLTSFIGLSLKIEDDPTQVTMSFIDEAHFEIAAKAHKSLHEVMSKNIELIREVRRAGFEQTNFDADPFEIENEASKTQGVEL